MGGKRKLKAVSEDITLEVVITPENENVEPEALKEENKGYQNFEFETYLMGNVVVNYRGTKLISIFKDGVNILNNICHYDYIAIMEKIRK